MKKLLYLLLFSASILRGQSPLYTIYREQTATINPAMPSTNYLISEYNNSVSATYHYQWLGVEGAPVTQDLNWEWLPTDKNVLVGAHLTNDKTGDIGLTGFSGQFAYKVSLSRTENRLLCVGLSAGVQSFRANLASVAAIENLGVENSNRTIFDLNMGAYYHHGKSFYVGISTPQLVGNTLVLSSSAPKGQEYTVQKVGQVYAVGGMFIDAPFFGNDGAYLEPSVWMRYVPKSRDFSFDLNLRAKISNSFWVGTGYNLYANTLNIETGSILGESVGLQTGQVKIGLGFGIPMGTRWTGLGPIGEIHLCYAWGK
jgi:type IX secretion system PorP/SprF family membrane protein